MIKATNVTGSISRNAGGLYESVRRLAQSLHADGMNIQVFGIQDEHTATDIGAWAPVPVSAFRSRFGRQFGYAPELRAALDAFAPDITHTHGLWLYPSVVTNQITRRRGVPHLISPHGMLDPWAVRNSSWKKAIAHFLYEGAHLRSASCLRALCESEALSIRRFGLKNPIAIIPNGIDLPDIENAEMLKTETLKSARRKAGETNAPWQNLVEPGKKILLFLSRIHPKKGLVNLLKAWAENRRSETGGDRKSDEWVLAIAGWDQGGHEAELKSLASELGLAWADVRGQTAGGGDRGTEVGGRKSVLFLGPQFNEAKVACYRHCDAFILPSFSEGLPMVVLEAWAYAKPVIMTPECNLPEGFQAGAALQMEATVAGTAAGLHELWRMSDTERTAMGGRGRALVAERFTWPHISRQMEAVYDWMLGGGTRPGSLDWADTKR